MWAVVAASACPSHLAMTASGTCNACGMSGGRRAADQTDTGSVGELAPHPREQVGGIGLPASLTATYPLPTCASPRHGFSPAQGAEARLRTLITRPVPGVVDASDIGT